MLRLPAAHEEWSATPQHDRRGENKLQPVRPLLVEQHVEIGEVAAHFEREDRKREHQRNPEPPRHVRKLGIGRRFGGGQLRLQRHAADRADAEADLPDLQMHRAGIDRAVRRRRRLRRRSRVAGVMAMVVRQGLVRRRIRRSGASRRGAEMRVRGARAGHAPFLRG